MLNSSRVKLKMSTETHKYIIGTGGSIDPKLLSDEELTNNFELIRIEHDNRTSFKHVEFIPIFISRTGDGFTIQLD